MVPRRPVHCRPSCGPRSASRSGGNRLTVTVFAVPHRSGLSQSKSCTVFLEIDVTEDAGAIYVQHGVNLQRLSQPFRRPPRSAEAWAPEIVLWCRFANEGGKAFGAFEAGRIVGIAVLRARLEKHTDQLAGLYVDGAWRRQGLASALVERVVEAALTTGAENLYVSAVPSESAVGFYLSRGFQPVAIPHPELFELEPEDIHMSLTLR